MNFNKKIILNSLDDTADIAKEIASELETYPKNKASIIFLEGDLGTCLLYTSDAADEP